MDDVNNEPELSDVQPESSEPAAAPPVPEPTPEPTPEPVVEPTPEPMVEHEPEPEPALEFELEPEPEPEPEKTSFLKKEISFKRKPKPVDEWDEPDAEEKPEKTSFLKKEISFKRKPKPEEESASAVDDAEPDFDDGDETEKTSFLKKDISFKRRRKRKPVEEWDDVDSDEDLDSDEDEPEKTPFYKKDLSFKRKPKPEPELDEPAAEHRPRKKRARSSRESAGHKRQKRVVGLKIGGSQLAAARIVNNGHPELVQYAREDLEQTVVVGGELREPELLAEALRLFFKKHKLPRTGIRLGIANNRIGVRIFEIAGITDPRQLENAVRFRAQEVLPIPIEEAVMDYHVLGDRVDEDGTPLTRILLVVAYRKLIDRYVDACRKAGLRLSGIDLEAFALLRALAEPRDEEDGAADAAIVVVAIGHDRSTFAVSDGRVCEFTRVLDWGGGILNVVIARELDVSPSEAIDVKHQLSLVDDAVPEGLTPEQAQRVRDAVRRQLQTFARELVSSLQFYQNQPGSLGIGEIVITGGTAHLAGLAQELNRLIGVRVTVGDPLARVKVGRKVGEEEQLGSLSIAIGLGIED